MKGSPGSAEEEEVKETLISILLHFQKPKGENKTMGRKKKRHTVSVSHFNGKNTNEK